MQTSVIEPCGRSEVIITNWFCGGTTNLGAAAREKKHYSISTLAYGILLKQKVHIRAMLLNIAKYNRIPLKNTDSLPSIVRLV